jgi:hypothetical protein
MTPNLAMNITEQVALMATEGLEVWKNDENFLALRAFYEEMIRLGVAKKPEYTAAPLDTTGRGLYQAFVLNQQARLSTVKPLDLGR